MKKIIHLVSNTAGLYLLGISTKVFAVDACNRATDKDCINIIEPAAGDPKVSTYIGSITTWILNITGAIAVLFIIWGGILYVTSNGNKDKAEQAKQTLTYAVIGLIFVVLARVIVSLVFNTANDIF